VDKDRGRQTKDGIRIYDPSDFAGMHAAGRLAATYKHASCISVNHVVCHGIPSDKKLKDGDILNIDVTVIVDGWFGDTSRMYVAGKLPRKAERLIDVTHDSLMLGIEAVKPGNTFGDIGHAIQSFVESHRMSVVTDFCGHGLGRVFHAPPNVLHYGRPGTGAVLEPGMFFTIEPMVNLGRAETKTLADDWTAVTRDKSLSAQFEHSIGVRWATRPPYPSAVNSVTWVSPNLRVSARVNPSGACCTAFSSQTTQAPLAIQPPARAAVRAVRPIPLP